MLIVNESCQTLPDVVAFGSEFEVKVGDVSAGGRWRGRVPSRGNEVGLRFQAGTSAFSTGLYYFEANYEMTFTVCADLSVKVDVPSVFGSAPAASPTSPSPS